jgi:O-antigen ligase
MALRPSQFRLTTSLFPADLMAMLIAASLPWSTSLPAIFVGLWLLALVPITDLGDFLKLAKRPICFCPIFFFFLALVGTLWSAAPWYARVHSVGPLAKLLAIPLLIYHFQHSTRGPWVFTAFFVSSTLLMVLSWIVAIDPHLALKPNAYYGVPVKNYIDQSQEFALCTVGVLYVIAQSLRQQQWLKAGILAMAAAGFFTNMAFIVVSRTAIVTMPIMLGIFALFYLSRRGMTAVLGTVLVIVVAVWFASPSLRERTATFFSQYNAYETTNEATSVGMRLEFWRKSLQFFREAPVIGHGTGSVKLLFTEAAANQSGASAEIIANPHNQTLYAAVQWGIVGVAVLYAMWLCHLLLFRGTSLAHWIGLLVVAQNMLTSVFNSHLFDFHAGWMYVLGVGVAGGTVLAIQVPAALQNPPKEDLV